MAFVSGPLYIIRKMNQNSHNSTAFEILWDCLASIEGVSSEVVQELRQRWNPADWRPIGELLVRRKALSFSQVSHLIRLQLDQPYMRLGELAVREGYCTMEQVQQALDVQRKEFPGPIELLIDDDRLDRDIVLQALVAYSRMLEERVRSFVENGLGKRSA